MLRSPEISKQNLCFVSKPDNAGGRKELSDFSTSLPLSSRSLNIDLQEITPENPIPFFRMSIKRTANGATAASRSKALNALVSFSDVSSLSFSSFTPEFATCWAAWLIQSGYSQKTAAYYLKQIATLYNEAVSAGLADEPNPFSSGRAALLGIPENSFSIPDKDTVERLRKFFRDRETIPQSVRRFAADIVAFSILAGGISFSEIASLKKSSPLPDDETIRRIAGSYARPRNKYLFPLDQSNRTPSQLKKEIAKLFHIALSPYGISLSPIPENTPFDLWALVAISNGIDPASLSSLSGGKTPTFNPMIPLLSTLSVPEQERENVRATVARTLVDNPLEWHAMQFRPFVDFDKVKQAMDECRAEVSFAELFYPDEEITRRVGNKIKRERRPLIPGLLFFRSRATEIAPMFRHIGHLAWCYRQSGARSGSYAVIPKHEMQTYMTVIGQFSPDMEIFPAGFIPVKENDRVIMIGGNFAGLPATVTAIKHQPDGEIICKLLFIGGNGVEWKVNADPRLLKPIDN